MKRRLVLGLAHWCRYHCIPQACLVVTWRVSSHEQTKNPVNLTGSQNPDVQHVHDHDDTTDQRTGEAGDFSESNFHGVIHDATEREDSAEPGDAKPDGGKDSISDTRLVAMPCGYYGYWNETKKMCLTCPFCPEGQKLTEVSESDFSGVQLIANICLQRRHRTW